MILTILLVQNPKSNHNEKLEIHFLAISKTYLGQPKKSYFRKSKYNRFDSSDVIKVD